MQTRHARFVWITDDRDRPPREPLAAWLAQRPSDPQAVAVGLLDATAEVTLQPPAEVDALAVVDTGPTDAGSATATRTGADDVVDLHEPEARWRERLARLVDLAAMRREARRRRATAAVFNARGPAVAPASERPPVLFVGPAGGDQLQVVDALSGWTVPAYAETTAHAARHLEQGRYTAVVVTGVADASALEATLVPLARVEGPSAPSFVVVRPARAGFDQELAFRLGAHEVLEPGLAVDLVQRRLTRAVREAALRAALREHDAFAGALDPLTGRLEHGAFHAHVQELLHPDPPSRAALVALRLDGLDQLNRDVGFAAGDRCLAAVGHGLARSVRAGDVVARVDGAGFAVWVETIDDAALTELAARLEARVRRDTAGEMGPAVHVRIGWARPEPGDDALALARRARDAARRTLLRAAG